MTRWALRIAGERRAEPAGIALRGGPALASRRYAVEGRRMHVRASVAPRPRTTPVVLVHGVIVSSRYLLPTAVELAADFTVVVPDLPGYGFSDPEPTAPTVATLADTVIDAALAAGHPRVSLVGNSFGAQIAVEAALRHPDRVERIALLGPTVDPAARSVLRQYARWQRNAPDEHLSSIPVMARDLVDVGFRRAARLLRVMVADPIEDKLPQVRCAALVVRGGRDRVVPMRWARRAADLLPRGELVVVPGYAHMAHYSGPLAVVSVLRPFLLGA
jgi:2-hydroxy-6-oxonona-2,4-dienedioate hydrolase